MKYALKVQVNEKNQIKLYPEEGETTTILNIKRGIVSALAAPGLEDNKYTPTIHGLCKNSYSLSNPAEMTLTRDLSGCDRFVPLRDQTSPLALLTGLHYPLAQLVRSSQTCNYKFDEEKNHIVSGTCTEKHLLVPFSSEGEYGVTNVGKQEVTLIEVAPHNDRVFDIGSIVKDLSIDMVEDRTMTQDKDAALELLRKLSALPETDGETRAHLFHKLVLMVRGMKLDTLSPALPEALEVSPMLTYQVLAQCGTPECSSAIMELLRARPTSGPEVDAFVYALGLVANPSPVLINDMLQMAQQKPSKPVLYALSNVVNRFYKAEGQLVPEIFSVARFMVGQIGDCSGDKDQMFLTLRVIGNMAPAMANAGPAVRGAVLECVNKPEAAPEVQLAAIQVFRLAPVPEEGRETLMQVLLDSSAPVQKRIAAYLVLMKDPQPSELAQLMSALPTEPDAQIKNFIISHIKNIGTSTEPATQELRQKIFDATTDNQLGSVEDSLKLSRNLKVGLIQSNLIFEGASYLPKEVMLEMTLKAFGFDLDMMEVGMEGKGFEPTVEALFGENGFFPDTALKTMYFVSDNVPLMLQNVLPGLRSDRKKRQTSQNLVKDITQNLKKLVNDLKTSDAPEATVYLRLLGNELGYMKTTEMEEMAYSAAMFVVKALTTMTDTSLYAHYIFMDNEFFLPTLTGVPLRIALSGTFTPGFKGGLKLSPQMNEVAFMPSAGIEFVTQVGTHIPEYVDSGLEMHTNIYHESGLSAKVTIEKGQVQLRLPAPQTKTKLVHITNSLVARSGAETLVIPPKPMDVVSVDECTPFFSGMKYCYALQYNDAWNVERTPYFPFTGDSKVAVELMPTGEVTEYTATLAYELLREGEEGKQKVDAFKFILRAEGTTTHLKKHKHAVSMLQLQMLVPILSTDATFTANLNRDEEIKLELKSDIKVLEAKSEQKITLKYGKWMYNYHFRYSKAVETKAVYYFNNERWSVYIPMPFGGKSTMDLNFPEVLNTPRISVPQIGLEIVPMEIPVPELFVPEGFTLYVPLFGKAEVSAILKSNLYDMEATIAAGKDIVETPSYSATIAVTGTSPVDVLSGSLVHKFLEANVNIVEEINLADKLIYRANIKIDATSPLGVSVNTEYNGVAGLNTEKLTIDSNFDGLLKAGAVYGKVVSYQSASVAPFTPEAKIESSVEIDSTFAKAQNTFNAELRDGALSVLSNTNAFDGTVVHIASVDFKDQKLTVKSDANAEVMGLKMKNQIEAAAGAGEVVMRMETNSDYAENRVYSLMTASLNAGGLAVNSDATLKLLNNEAIHKANMQLNQEGLVVSGTNTLQSPLSVENTFNGISYADMTANAKTSTTGKVFGTHMNHNTELEVIGLAARFSHDARFNSQPMRFDYTVRSSVVPFDFNLDAIFNADGDLTLYGKHSAQLYGKFLVKAQPLAFANTQEWRASMTQALDNGMALETTFDNKWDTALSLEEQKTSYRLRSKMNNHIFNQDMSLYNTAERVGVEMSGALLTNLLNQENAENQEFAVSGFVKYDKNTNMQVIQLPLMESFPIIVENLKGAFVYVAEAVLDFINNEEVRAKLEAIPQHVSNFIVQLNLEEKINGLKQFLSDLTQEYKIFELIEYIMNFSFQMVDVDAFFGDLSFNFLPVMPEIVFPEFTLSDISFPAIPEVPVEKFVKSLQLPEIKLPTIPSEFAIPSFGKLYGEIRVQTPMYSTKTTAELQNSTENEQSPQMTAFITSQGVCPAYDIFNYKIDSTARLAIPKMSRIVIGETVKFEHVALGVEHQGSLNLYDGMSASLETTFNQIVDIPVFSVKLEANGAQKAIARLDGLKITVTVDNTGKTAYNGEEGNHKSNLDLTMTPSLITLTFNGDTDSAILKMKQVVNAEAGTLSYLKFNIRNEAETPFLKSSEIVAVGQANLFDMKVDITANHNSELVGPVQGNIANDFKYLISPREFVFELKNKGTNKVNVLGSLTAKLDAQNEISAYLNSEMQKINTVNMVRFNKNMVFVNLTVDNSEKEIAVILGVDGQANLDFLTSPISIPEIELPFVDFRTPEVSNLNLYEQTVLKDILTTTEQSVSLDAKVAYQKSMAPRLFDIMGLIQVPDLGNLVTELTFKSAIINLNLNAALETEDDIVFRLGATTASVFESLKAKLDGTTSLTTRRGIKLANSLSLENQHIEGTHDSTVSVSTETYETTVSVATVGKVALPILNLEINQNLVADNKAKPNAASTFRVNGQLNIPRINAMVKAEAEHSTKMEATFEYLSMETSNRANMDGTMLEDYLVLGVLDNELNFYLNKDGLRSNAKVIADAKLNQGANKIFAVDVNENLAIEAALSRVYVVLKYTGNNEANLFNFNTKGRHVAQGTIDFAPISSLIADIEIDLSQPTNFGDLTIYEKATAEVTADKQKAASTSRFVSPVYTVNLVVEAEGDYPVLKVIAKSSATSPLSLLEYDLDGKFK
uniref:Vitellogenin domain-containing protein n=1 Tax=Periophthalmus magnuspinnatus TaxID=409849 RepID=A0A3B4BLR2_9GOBI